VPADALDLCLGRPTALPSRRRDCSMATEGEGFRRRLVRFATEQFNVEHPVDRDRRGGPQPQGVPRSAPKLQPADRRL
jgi:hypothetical protein